MAVVAMAMVGKVVRRRWQRQKTVKKGGTEVDIYDRTARAIISL